MSKAIISLKDERAMNIVKEARKKSIDDGISFSEAVLMLLDKWVGKEITIEKRGERK